MAEAPEVVAIVLNWNGERVLGRCLDCLTRTDYPRLRLVVADNGSGDPSLGALQSRFPGVEFLLMERNHGYAGGNNRAMRRVLAHGGADFVALLNNDVFVEPGWLAPLVATLARHPRAAACGPKVVLDGDPARLNSLGLRVARDGRAWDEGIFQADAPPARGEREVAALTGAAMLVRRRSIEEVGLMDERYFLYYEDVDWCLRMRARGWEIWCNRDAVVRHGLSVSGGGAETPEKARYFWRNRLLLLVKMFPYAAVGRALAEEIRSAWWLLRAGELRRAGERIARMAGIAPRGLRMLLGRTVSGDPGHEAWRAWLTPAEEVPTIVVPPDLASPRAGTGA